MKRVRITPAPFLIAIGVPRAKRNLKLSPYFLVFYK